ncbi:unnamed protein product [Pleuronectes platessa]|uniref:Uncharacterized protein n=1 Tax=Pleuronectes platessa TaxID=8262 RepID=A0A9N7YJW1_PLEPL|nr:unnamed protein product [Pleuronectes platessa]
MYGARGADVGGSKPETNQRPFLPIVQDSATSPDEAQSALIGQLAHSVVIGEYTKHQDDSDGKHKINTPYLQQHLSTGAHASATCRATGVLKLTFTQPAKNGLKKKLAGAASSPLAAVAEIKLFNLTDSVPPWWAGTAETAARGKTVVHLEEERPEVGPCHHTPTPREAMMGLEEVVR